MSKLDLCSFSYHDIRISLINVGPPISISAPTINLGREETVLNIP